jgi:predicted acetyltransferase
METEPLALCIPALTWRTDFLLMAREYAAADERPPIAPDLDEAGFAEYLRRLDDQAQGVGLKPGLVPQSTWWLVRGGLTVVGYSRLRGPLPPALEEFGHISYSIRPTERRKGYGTTILALTLEKARALGQDRAQLTCETSNVASARVIEKNGGILASAGLSQKTNTHISRYWIAL